MAFWTSIFPFLLLASVTILSISLVWWYTVHDSFLRSSLPQLSCRWCSCLLLWPSPTPSWDLRSSPDTVPNCLSSLDASSVPFWSWGGFPFPNRVLLVLVLTIEAVLPCWSSCDCDRSFRAVSWRCKSCSSFLWFIVAVFAILPFSLWGYCRRHWVWLRRTSSFWFCLSTICLIIVGRARRSVPWVWCSALWSSIFMPVSSSKVHPTPQGR